MTLVLLAASLPAYAQAGAAAPQCSARSAAQRVPLAELYTSEGCSSCPPADRWLSSQIGDLGANFLAFHVDYWDDIGWPDRFSSPLYSQRQRERVQTANGNNVYTPQVMLGRKVQADWRDRSGWERTLQQQRQLPSAAALALRLQRSGTGWEVALGASRIGPPATGTQVWLARYEDAQVTQVRAGENRGANLRHDRVVRQLAGPWPLGAEPLSKLVPLPPDAGAWGVIAIVQAGDGQVLQSLRLAADGCDG
ncbi:MAG: DUF1223 domain-containing protein [Pseudoxanthomonas sp.]